MISVNDELAIYVITMPHTTITITGGRCSGKTTHLCRVAAALAPHYGNTVVLANIMRRCSAKRTMKTVLPRSVRFVHVPHRTVEKFIFPKRCIICVDDAHVYAEQWLRRIRRQCDNNPERMLIVARNAPAQVPREPINQQQVD